MTIMSVPKASMDEDYGAIPWKHKVWLAWQTLVMEDIAKAFGMQASANNHFGLGILAPDACHHPA